MQKFQKSEAPENQPQLGAGEEKNVHIYIGLRHRKGVFDKTPAHAAALWVLLKFLVIIATLSLWTLRSAGTSTGFDLRGACTVRAARTT